LETIAATLVTALAVGASAALKDTATTAVKDAYAALKHLIKNRYAGQAVEALEETPESMPMRSVVEQRLQHSNAASDVELRAALQRLLDVLAEHEPTAGGALGVDLADIRAKALRITDVQSSDDAVIVRNAAVDGAIHIGGIRAGVGREGRPSKKA
jgi:hypothetical protein